MVAHPVNLTLDADERAMLDGAQGPAVQLAMRILTRMAPLYGASSLLPVTRAHVDGVILTGGAGLAFAERLAELGGRVAVPTTLNVMSMDRERWHDLGLDAAYAERASRLGEAYLRMGARSTFTCAPYQTEHAPVFGEQIAWSESNAVAFANSVIGARTNRYGDYLDICCALTGRVPAAGLHLEEPRLATVVVELEPIPPELALRDDFYPVLGYLLGSVVAEEIPVVTGLECKPTEDQLKAMAAAAASSGEVAMFHIAGITPEAPTLSDALGYRAARRTLTISMTDLQRTREALTTTMGSQVDVVAFGSPHCSLAECRALAKLMSGSRASPSVRVFVTTSRAVRDLLARSGELAILEAFGARVTADTCIVVAPLVHPDAKVLMTNSAKYAHYGPGLLGVDSVFATTEECVASAIAGRVMRADGPWQA
ncbi:MAG TPA: aconitase X catalytic domain-containing protein [Thermomicrobiales bacterium]|nr:aconitase X catalytic domain-containing protein [Thermomicrobiales bacterium]